MATYVDPMFTTMRSKKWPYKSACHLTADTDKELHQIARLIGLKREWHQGAGRASHYDLTASMRKKAIAAGAVPITRGIAAEMFKGGRREQHK